jgi:hypothetical protein
MSQNEAIKTQENGKDQRQVPDPEVVAQAKRRKYSAESPALRAAQVTNCAPWKRRTIVASQER